MNYKKMMLVSIFLLAILTVGAVSASDEDNFNETLTVEDTQEVSLDASFENDTISAQEEEVLEDGITEDNFNVWISSHQWEGADWGPQIVSVWGDDSVRQGNINLTIAKDAQTFSHVKAFDGADAVSWDLNELREGIVNEVGTYKISLKYHDEGTEIDLGQYDFTLLNFDFMVQVGDLYWQYPFDIIRLNDDFVAEVYVNSKDEPYTIETRNPIGWTLSDLDISSVGEYNITVVTYDEDDVVADNFTFRLNIVGNHDWFRLYSQFNIKNRDLGKPVLYLFSPEGLMGNFSLRITSEDIDFEKVIPITLGPQWMGWTLDELGIEENSGYNVQLLNNGEYSGDVSLNVDGIIDENSFNKWMSSHESITNNGETWIVNVHAHDGLYEGNVTVSIVNGDGVNKTFAKSFEKDADEHNDVIFTMDDLSEILNEPGTYTFNVTYIKDDTKVDLITDSTFVLTHFNYGAYEGEIYKDYPFDIIRIWDDDVDVKVYVGDNTTHVPSGGDNPLRWTLDDLDIDSPGDYTVTVNASKDGLRDIFTFNLKVFGEIEDFILYSNSLSVGEWEIDEPVLYLFSKEENIGKTLKIVINDGDPEWEVKFDVNGTVMIWDLESLEITENRGYDIRLFDGEAELASAYLDVNGFEEPINVDIWDEEEKGKLYNDYTGSVISVDVPEDKRYGTIIVIVNGEDEYSWEVDWEDNYHEWSLADLEITEDGEYNIVVKQVGYDDEEILAEGILNITTFNNDAFRAVLDKDENLIKVFCPDYADGRINIYVERENEDGEPDFVNEVDQEILNEDKGNWVEWSLEELGFVRDNNYYMFTITVFDSDAKEVYSYSCGHSAEGLEINIWDSEESPLYTDTIGTVIQIRCPDSISGMLYIIVDGDEKFHTIITSENHFEAGFDGYEWDLKTLGITQAGDYNITLKLDDEIISEFTLHVEDFNNDAFRAQVIGEDEPFSLYLFTPYGAVGNVTFVFKGWDDEIEEEVTQGNLTLELNESYWNKWTMIDYYMDYDTDRVDISVDGEEVFVEYKYPSSEGENSFTVNEEEIFSHDDVVIWVYANTTDNDYTINITSGDYTFIKNVTELGDYEFVGGNYKYSITLEDLDMFESINDKSKILITYDVGNLKSLANRWSPVETYTLEKNGEFIRLHKYEGIRVNLIGIEWAHGEDEEYDDDNIVLIKVPDSLNIHETALLNIRYGNNEITKSLSDLYSEYDYEFLGVRYYISWDDLDLEGVQGNYVLNISVTADDEQIGFRQFFISFDEEEGWGFDDYDDSIKLIFYYGQIGDLEFGQGEASDYIIELSIPKYLDITEGTIIITDENGEVIFTKALSEFEENCISSGVQSNDYWIADEDFNYSKFEENVPFAVSFAYDSVTKVYARGIREGDELHRITTPEEVADYFKVTLSEGILINGSDNAIIIEATDNANRQSVNIDLGGGYFAVYVNGKKVENLGSLVGYDGESELEFYLLQRGSGDGSFKLIIYLSDLNITDNGEYNIRVTHNPVRGETSSNIETELFNQNITLTSNVKVDNVTSGVFTGFGMDPILLYLDTYYGDINETSGTITVLNSDSNVIFTKDIKSLSKDENGRYYLKYSDFENKNFGENITVMYSDGNERSGNTTVNVTWKDVDSDVFNPTVKDDVNDYYGDLISLNIPELLNEGQIIVTVKFKNNPSTNISNMDVNTDFNSQAVYRFNVADIKANYGNDFALALSDLGFYVENGNYDLDVKFTADGTNTLNITNGTVAVGLSKDINITVNATSRFTQEAIFAAVKIFEPEAAFSADLFIDGVLYSHKTFEKGLITFMSSPNWASGTHVAEIRAYNEYGSVVANKTREFEVLIKSDDVEVSYDDSVKEGRNASITLTVPKECEAFIQIDNGAKVSYNLSQGANTIDLGVLSHGNHTIGIFYDGNESFYFNYVNVDVEYESWLDMPYPIVLDDEDIIRFNLDEDATGNVTVEIDGKPYAEIPLENGKAEVKITDLEFGTHSFTITYSGDDAHPRVSQSGDFNVTYIFKDDIIGEGYPLKGSYVVTVILPADATGTVTLYVDDNINTLGINDLLGAGEDDGNALVSDVKDGKAVFTIEGLTMGEHKIHVVYSGDEKYPAGSYDTILDINRLAVIGEISADNKNVSLMMPANATGKLVVYNDNRRNVVISKDMENGYAFIDLNDLSVGVYELRAYYEGDDYEVESYSVTFKVLPEVDITQNATVGENITIKVDLDESTGNILIVIDEISPILEEIIDGKINRVISTTDYGRGNHNVTFMYIGNSFDGDVFNVYNEKTGRYVPVVYAMNILPEKTIVTGQDNGNYHEEYVRKENGEIAYDARGTIQMYVNGVLMDVQNVVNGMAKFDLSKFKNGKYYLEFVYSGDSKYDSSSRGMEYVINNRIAAGDLSVQYTSGKSYSVTVYNSDGSRARNVQVSFSINNKAFRIVTTNANGVASVVITSAPGSYKITSTALGVSVTKTLKVTHVLSLKKVKVKRSAKKLVIKVTLKKVKGKYLKGKKITLKFNGKKFKAKTNKNGVAKFTIKKKFLKKLKVGKKVKYQATYLKDTVKKTVKVKK